jgi:peroxiredoxin
MSLIRLIGVLALTGLIHGVAVGAEDGKHSSDNQTTAPARGAAVDPTILLIRDDAVRAELKCTSEQRTSLDDLLKQHNRMLLAIRDVGPTGADETAKPQLLEIRQTLAKSLDEAQRKRLQSLILQAQGYDSLARKDVATTLKLSDQQQQELAAISEEFRNRTQELQKSSLGAGELLKEQLQQLQKDRQQRVLKVLDKRQTELYAAMLGEPFDFSKVKPSPANAPEFETIEAWLNSDGVTMESLRGKVVVVHFFAFGCINCIHNFPWYRDWNEKYPGRGVAIIGIHTPETQAEQDNEKLRAALDKHGLKFPVAVDKQKKMWQAWYNGIWPSVYIVDKHGRLRYWWYGELDWEGAGNQKVAEQQIEQLLAEK